MRALPPLSGGATSHQLSSAIHRLARGGGLNTGMVPFAASPATTTTVTDPNMTPEAYVLLVPLDAAAAANPAAVAPYISVRALGSFVVTHEASASARTFGYVIVGA